MLSSNELTPLTRSISEDIVQDTAIDIDNNQASIITVYPKKKSHKGLDLHEDIFLVIVSFLSYRDLLNLGQISRAMYQFIEKYQHEMRRDIRLLNSYKREASVSKWMAINPEPLNNVCNRGCGSVGIVSGIIGVCLGAAISFGVEYSKGENHEIDGLNIALWAAVGALAAPLGGAAALGYRKLGLYYRNKYQADFDNENKIQDRFSTRTHIGDTEPKVEDENLNVLGM